MICDRLGASKSPFFATICNSTDEHAFPAQPLCTCTWSADNKSGVRAWGNPLGPNYYDEDEKRILKRKLNAEVTQRAQHYAENLYRNGVPEFLTVIPAGQLSLIHI